MLLKKGALVMCIKNSSDKKYVNGSLGVVNGFDEDTHYPIVELRSGRTILLSPETWELRDGTKKRASISQLPLRLAWAITVHKSQGMTLDAARIDLRKAFVEGMGYVALSRVKRLDALSLLGINRMALQVSRDALEINELLLARSKQDLSKFEHLAERAKQRTQEEARHPQKEKATSNWSERLAKMRLTYPNAFKPWKKTDDELLIATHQEGCGLKELSALLQRQPGGVRARLKKHLGEDVRIKL
jgi:hypothetical protein